MLVTCLNCNIKFEKSKSNIKKSPNHYCSRSCACSANNKKNPRRKPEGTCIKCGVPCKSSRQKCPKCISEHKPEDENRFPEAASLQPDEGENKLQRLEGTIPVEPGVDQPAGMAPLQAPQIEFDEAGFRMYVEKLRDEQNLALAILVGGAAALLGALLWAALTVITDYQLGIAALGIGLLVGIAVRYAGKGIDRIYGIVGGILSFL